MKSTIILFVILSCFLSFCYHQRMENQETLEIVKISDAFERREPININDISGNCKYILLEQTKESLIGSNYTVYSDDQYLIVIEKKRILLFDRDSGKFIRTIGKSGSGPNEYSNTYTKLPYDEEKRVVYADRSRERYEYSINGQLLNKIKGPELVRDFVNINDRTYAAFINNYMGDEKNKMIIFDETDSTINIFPNYQFFPFKGIINVYDINSWFYKLNKQLYFCERFSDTLFKVTADSLIPRFVFNKGAYTFPDELRGDNMIVPIDKYFFTENILESSKFLFFSFKFKEEVYTAVYDKKKKNTLVNDYIGKSGKGYINNAYDFVPLELSSINSKGELTCTIDAFKIKQWFEKNAEKSYKLPDNLQNLKNISEMGNPIVMISKLNE